MGLENEPVIENIVYEKTEKKLGESNLVKIYLDYFFKRKDSFLTILSNLLTNEQSLFICFCFYIIILKKLTIKQKTIIDIIKS